MEEFIELFQPLPDEVKQLARKNYRLWQENHRHPSLQFKQVHSTESFYSVRIGRNWRAIGLLEGDGIYWFWIGSHDEYERFLKQL